jgi:8-oxo-dGTP pyrophosphatase MutT (NUDIX family)
MRTQNTVFFLASAREASLSLPLSVNAPVPLREVRYQAAVIRDEHLLLVRVDLADGRTFWLMPGGGREPDDRNPEETIRREVHEETGLRVTVEALLMDVEAHPDDIRYARWHTYLCRVEGGDVSAGASDGIAQIAAILWLPLETKPVGCLRSEAINSAPGLT